MKSLLNLSSVLMLIFQVNVANAEEAIVASYTCGKEFNIPVNLKVFSTTEEGNMFKGVFTHAGRDPVTGMVSKKETTFLGWPGEDSKTRFLLTNNKTEAVKHLLVSSTVNATATVLSVDYADGREIVKEYRCKEDTVKTNRCSIRQVPNNGGWQLLIDGEVEDVYSTYGQVRTAYMTYEECTQ